jgi:hypothetical protein
LRGAVSERNEAKGEQQAGRETVFTHRILPLLADKYMVSPAAASHAFSWPRGMLRERSSELVGDRRPIARLFLSKQSRRRIPRAIVPIE